MTRNPAAAPPMAPPLAPHDLLPHPPLPHPPRAPPPSKMRRNSSAFEAIGAKSLEHHPGPYGIYIMLYCTCCPSKVSSSLLSSSKDLPYPWRQMLSASFVTAGAQHRSQELRLEAIGMHIRSLEVLSEKPAQLLSKRPLFFCSTPILGLWVMDERVKRCAKHGLCHIFLVIYGGNTSVRDEMSARARSRRRRTGITSTGIDSLAGFQRQR